MTIAASLMWVGAAEKPEQSKITLENNKITQNNSLNSQTKFNQNQIENTEVKKIRFGWSVWSVLCCSLPNITSP